MSGPSTQDRRDSGANDSYSRIVSTLRCTGRDKPVLGSNTIAERDAEMHTRRADVILFSYCRSRERV